MLRVRYLDEQKVLLFKMEMELRIEKALPDELEELAGIWEMSVRATHTFLSESEIMEIRREVVSHYLHMLDLYVCRSGNRICGFMGIGEDKVEMLFVAPEFVGKGAGRALLEYAVDEKNARRLDVNEQNTQAAGFYKHMGFVVVSRSATDSGGRPLPLLHMELG